MKISKLIRTFVIAAPLALLPTAAFAQAAGAGAGAGAAGSGSTASGVGGSGTSMGSMPGALPNTTRGGASATGTSNLGNNKAGGPAATGWPAHPTDTTSPGSSPPSTGTTPSSSLPNTTGTGTTG